MDEVMLSRMFKWRLERRIAQRKRQAALERTKILKQQQEEYIRRRRESAKREAAKARKAAEAATDIDRGGLLLRAEVYENAAKITATDGAGYFDAGGAYEELVTPGPAVCYGCGEKVPYATRPDCCLCDDCQRPRSFRKYQYTAPGTYQYNSETKYHGGRWLAGEW